MIFAVNAQQCTFAYFQALTSIPVLVLKVLGAKIRKPNGAAHQHHFLLEVSHDCVYSCYSACVQRRLQKNEILLKEPYHQFSTSIIIHPRTSLAFF